MLTYLQPSQEIRQAELMSFIPPWLKALTLQVEAQELQRDTIVTYERGVRKFIHWLNDQFPSANVIRAWKGEIPFNPTQTIKGASRKGKAKHEIERLSLQLATAPMTDFFNTRSMSALCGAQ